jgi:hypothetical protein
MRARFVVVALAVGLLAACAPGTPDLGFSPSGSVPYGVNAAQADGVLQLVAQADGGVIANRSPTRPLTRIDAEGVVDPSWGSSLPNTCRRTTRAIATGTSLLVTCSRLILPSGPEVWQVWRVTSAGHLDPTFGGGDGIIDVLSTVNEFDIVPLPNGGYLGLGHQFTALSTSSVPPLVKIVYSASGTALSSTEIAIPVPALPVEAEGWRLGFRLSASATGVSVVESVTARITANAFDIGMWRVQRFDANGATVATPPLVGPTGGAIVGNDVITGLVALRDGRTAVVGTRTAVNLQVERLSTDSFLWLVGPDGSHDPLSNGVPLLLANGGRLDPVAIAATNNERFLVVAGAPPAGAPLVARYDAVSGTLDPGFGNGGRARVALARASAVVTRSGLDQLYLGGADAQGRPAVARIWNHITP